MRAIRQGVVVRVPYAITAAAWLALVSPLAAQNPQSTQGPRADATASADPAFDPITHEGYIEPPDAIKKLVDAPRNMNVNYGAPSPGARRYFLRTLSENMPPLAQMGAPYYNLAGWQVDYRGNRSRNMTTRSLYGIELYDWQADRTIPVRLPDGARASGPRWSPDGTMLGYFANFDDATHIYVADPSNGRSRQITRTSVLATNVTSFYFTGDSRRIVTILIPDRRGPEPQPSAVAPTPVVRVNQNNRLRTRVIFDLLQNPYEMDVLEYHMTGQLAVIDVRNRSVKRIGEPGMIRSINPSPDGMYFRVTYLDRPFSYFQQINSWGTHELLIDAEGNVIRELSRRPLRDGTQVTDPDPTDPTDPTDPDDAPDDDDDDDDEDEDDPFAPRAVTWHPYERGQLFLQLARAPEDTTRFVDRLVHMPDLADTLATTVVYESANRIQAVRFSDDGRILFVTEGGPAAPPQSGRGGARGARGGRGGDDQPAGNRGRGGRGQANRTTEIAVFLDEGGAKYTIPIPRDDDDDEGRGGGGGGRGRGGRGGRGGGGGGGSIGSGGGAFVTTTGSHGNSVVMISSDGAYVFREGSEEMESDTTQERPFVERIGIKTGQNERIYESSSAIPETIVAPLNADFNRALIRRESSEVIEQQYILDLRTGEARQITDNKDYFPEIVNAKRMDLRARRADGLEIRVQVTLPPDYVEGTRLPALFWFYPSEFDSAAAYTSRLNGRGRGGRGGNNYPSYGPRTMAFVTAAGYALVEPDAPIVATDGRRPNDNYVRDLRENLQAVINMLDTMRIVDRNRLALGGHSYGAFSTVNAMVHTTFFKAGIAGDGNYNRTLTPNGFQNERRDLWQGRETYLSMSPFLYADQLHGALLLYHSTEDQNVGTDPIHSIKLFHALQGLGKDVALYMYPYEDHGPAARETVLDQWARWIAWLDKYVKNYGQDTRPIGDQDDGSGSGGSR